MLKNMKGIQIMKIAIPELKYQKNYYAALSRLGAEGIRIADALSFDPRDFDGLLIPGGVDIHPSIFGEEINGSRAIDPTLDYLQFFALDKCIKAEKPVLGICRGHQVLAAYFGCRLLQDIGEAGNEVHTKKVLADPDKIHPVKAVPGTLLHSLFGPDFSVNSSHHQAVREESGSYRIMATSEDGFVEAMYHESLPVFSTQFHPERMCYDFADDRYADGSLILKEFLKRCAAV